MDLHESRVEERQRQRRSRMQRREREATEPDESTLSRAGLGGQNSDIIEEIVDILDKGFGVSRATLRRETEKYLNHIGMIERGVDQNRGQDRT